MTDLLARIEALLQGNPARFIGYGAAIVIWLVVALASHLGFTQLGSNIDLPTALGLASGAIVTIVGVIESIRHFVYSPTTVAALTGADTAKPSTPGVTVTATPPSA